MSETLISFSFSVFLSIVASDRNIRRGRYGEADQGGDVMSIIFVIVLGIHFDFTAVRPALQLAALMHERAPS